LREYAITAPERASRMVRFSKEIEQPITSGADQLDRVSA
jgi:hypothetical protein